MPRRETQIFSLSMMDVISGAMGAFLIIMVVLMRYYKEDEEITKQREEVQKQLEEIQRQIDEAIQQLQDTTDVDVAELLRRLKAMQQQLAAARQKVNRLSSDLQAARSRVNQLQAQNRELQARANQLEQEKNGIQRKLDFRRPFMVLAEWDAPDAVNVDVFVESERIFGNMSTPQYFDPDENLKYILPGTLVLNQKGDKSSVDSWLERDSVAGANYKVYIVLKSDYPIVPTSVDVLFFGDQELQSLGTIRLDDRKRWQLVCFLMTDETGATTARVATEDERQEDLRAVELRMRQKKLKQTTQPSANRNDNRGGN